MWISIDILAFKLSYNDSYNFTAKDKRNGNNTKRRENNE